ncbi:HlyD family secretion protein [Gluconobacter sp. OJB]|uniref:HlyD family secretion protein n=1 Tax=Gluconobacter sp. OJB TaxID=3145196 RepID=UPI0031F823A6
MKFLLAFLGRHALTLGLVVSAAAVALQLWERNQRTPWTRDGHVRTDVVRVSTDIGGLITQVLVHDNQVVHPGQLLIVLDRPRRAAALGRAEAAITEARAQLDLARKEARRDLALRDLVATEAHEQNIAKIRTTEAALTRALADRDVALIDMQRTEIRATVGGTVTNLDLHPGDYLAVGAQAMALVDAETLRVEGYFEETKLRSVSIGDCARIHLMGDDADIVGHVESIAAAIADDQRDNSGNLLPRVAPTFSWVRLAQRIPVRVHIDRVPAGTKLIVGRTATVEILPSTTPNVVGRHL